jgi:hypothetical protein
MNRRKRSPGTRRQTGVQAPDLVNASRQRKTRVRLADLLAELRQHGVVFTRWIQAAIGAGLGPGRCLPRLRDTGKFPRLLISPRYPGKTACRRHGFRPSPAQPAPRGAAIGPRGSVIGPRGSVIGPCGAAIEPRGSVIEPCGAVIEPRGSAIRPCGAVIEP